MTDTQEKTNNKSSNQISNIIGFVGGMLMCSADWIMGFGATGTDSTMVMNVGDIEMSYTRLSLSMILALAGTILLGIGFINQYRYIKTQSVLRSVYRYSALASAVTWLLIHFMYAGTKCVYKLLAENGINDAYTLADKAFGYFTPIFYCSSLIMIVPFIVFFIAIVSGRTDYRRWYAAFYIFSFMIVFNIIAGLFGQSAVAGGIKMSAGNMAITIWMAVSLIYTAKQAD